MFNNYKLIIFCITTLIKINYYMTLIILTVIIASLGSF